MLHPPQLLVSLWVSTHAPLQSVWPEGQTQLPFVQVAVFGHTLPHPPQLAGSVCSSTHPPLHATSGAVHVDPPHAPPVHRLPLGQAFPHLPQLLGSEETSVHAPAQSCGITPWVQAHDPLRHASVDTQAVLQLPQCIGSLAVLTHA
jgi:hypothetical protein